MQTLQKLFRRLFRKPVSSHTQPLSDEELRQEFQRRYHSFKLLLTANNKALEIMSELESALVNDRPFGMSFVRSKCTALCVNVLRMAHHLDELAPGKYAGLFDAFTRIEKQLEGLLSTHAPSRTGRLILPWSDVDRSKVDEVGGKMAAVAEVANRVGLAVPPGFVITAAAYDRFMGMNDLESEIRRLIQVADAEETEQLFTLSARVQQMIIAAPLPREVHDAMRAAFHDLEQRTHVGVSVSVRSSALGEDVAGRAFAGQFRSQLNVTGDNLVHAYKEVVAGKFSLPAISYRLSHGIPDDEVAMCVGCMAMVDAVAGGVAYSRDPFDIRADLLLVNSGWGLPKAVVDGAIDPDLFVLCRQPSLRVLSRTVGRKGLEFACDPEGGIRREAVTGPKALSPSLTDMQVREIASAAIAIEAYYGCPQDMEWAVDREGHLFVLQCRPLHEQQGATHRIAASTTKYEPDDDLLLHGGVTAAPGVAAGPVHRVRKESDKFDFPENGVLVAVQALPAWATLLPKACAVVTEMGGVTGHLANVAREFGVPALFGMPAAMEHLSDGDPVTVDADTCRVYRGRKEVLITQAAARPNRMSGSAVHGTLERLVRHIVPLNLLNPDSVDFHPRNCRTLHDITRLVHEQAVQEMFSFGRDFPFNQQASKQLIDKVPMQWWIIDLNDGFNTTVKGKFVRVTDIASIPMLALWKGMTAVPWAGPPPVDAGGFMSVLMQATINPGLDPSLSSPYAVRNYFMIARNFCSLTSRFGFHLSTVEALVGERVAENYVSFVFKGGAADRVRRVRRASLVAQLLEDCSFRVEVREDAVSARVEGYPEEFMKDRLVVLGHLIMHTRQLDMVMGDEASVRTHRQRLTLQIKDLLQ